MAEAEDAAEDGAQTPEDGPPAVVFLDPELAEEGCAALAEDLGCAVRVLSPAEIDPHFPRPGDRAIVVPFSLPAQCGLDLVETRGQIA